MTSLRDAAMQSKAWPFVEARKVLDRLEKNPPKKGYALFETGYGPSGLPHIGTFGEVARTTMVRRAFEVLSDIPTKLICFSDDLDGMRKVPSNVPNRDQLQEHLQKPLTSVPDPFGTAASYGDHNNEILNGFLDGFGFDYDFISSTNFYRSGQFDQILLQAAERYDALMAIMLKSLRDERRETYSIFLPIHPETGRVLYVPMKHVDGREGTVTFDDPEGKEWTLPVTGGHVKLQWKPDFGARWAALDVDFEMYGKDHSTNTVIYDRICETLGGSKPEHYIYELFLDQDGHKISKTSGNGISMDEWLTYAGTPTLSYFMYQKPQTAKRLFFDVIPRAVDEYHQQLRAFEGQDETARLANPVFHIHNTAPGAMPPRSTMLVPFGMLLNLASVAGTDDPDHLWGFLKRYAPDASPTTHPDLDQAVKFALRYYMEFVRPTRKFRLADDTERTALLDLRDQLAAYDGPMDDEALQSIVYACGRERFDPLRGWFKALYEVLLGASQGPRFGGFIALYGVAETIALIDSALAGSLVTADEAARQG